MASREIQGREDAVKEQFLKRFRHRCAQEIVPEISGPTSGNDRKLLADNFFGSGGRFFLVEAKTSENHLVREGDKPASCYLCTALFISPSAQQRHRMSHFTSWAEGDPNEVRVRLGIYKDMVCNRAILPSCPACKTVPPKARTHTADEFMNMVLASPSDVGLGPSEFVLYVKWLLEVTSGHNKNAPFPMTLYGTSYSLGFDDKTFASYDDFHQWHAVVLANASPELKQKLASSSSLKRKGRRLR
ncbi:Uncharacterised protein [Burkholderia pseudomallei]|uniref:hypothetical protein n=1 Tax=Burkholderia pseudomallei TaxID=28450 RepID=UPI0001722BBD|nr:hypothetical protein [Burkholderia pseudomallei]EDS86551.1 hypothetical protein BURPSS13_G0095 [Burkholderia pseudomallei S13]MBF3439878.1 hypothetical protein [Burkholderia pseudomallei]MBF3464436.1 hypothetical protein [Burkholderia pseudomallei]CAJ3840879.1 Uncharacterised protein [Burkholderia pseudomallei]CAJ4602517.1 Uncharacterised protein [Burkholderia pseudomallei]